MDKYIKDGKVAVLYSPGYGAGWVTWNSDIPECLFDPEVVQMVLNGEHNSIKELCENKYPDGYWGGADDLTIEWVEPGAKFRVEEYDGSESVITLEDMEFFEA